MAKIDFTTVLLDREDKPVSEGDFITLKSTCQAVLYNQLAGLDDKPDSYKHKGEMALLGLKLQHRDQLDLKSEVVAMLKERINRACPTLIAFRACRLLEGKPQGLTEEELASE